MIGRAISHYRVLSTLGSGGMGVVYLAEDERLGRQVALKFLPTDSAASPQALERFRVEARAASSLSHPGICAIYDIGDDQGTPYIVMEALKGESLRDRINRGPLKVVDLLDIGIQLADALDAAHSQGIIHRDIKPSNIFVGDKHRTKILDFGLAKLAQSSTSLSSGSETRALNSTRRELTMPGSALGTVSYMSPEQARGEEVDTRTDLFSLGVVLYEMATGVQAFGGSTQAIIFDAILNRTPQPITHINPLIPPRLESLIATALEKERDLRHQHASDLEAELKRIRRDLESSQLVAATRTTVAPAADRRSATTTPSTQTATTARRSWILMTAGAVVVIALIVTGFNLWSDTSSRVAVAPAGNTPPAASPVAPTGAAAPAPAPTPPPEAASTPAPEPVAPAKPQNTAPPARPAPQPQQPVRPSPETRSQPAQPTPTPTPPSRPNADLPAPPVSVQAPPPSPGQPQTQAAQPTAPPSTPAPAVTQPPQAPVETPVAQPPPKSAAAAPPPTQPAIPPTSPVESDEALIRGVVRTYQRAFETKSIDLYRSVRPGLPAAEENRLRTSFNQINAPQQVDITIEELRVDGRMATVRLSRRDTIVNGGRRQTASSRQTLRLEKSGAGWIITDIIGR